MMLAIRLDPKVEERLGWLAKETGRTKTFYARAAIDQYLEDLEDYYIAHKRLEAFEPGTGIPLEQVMAELGLDD